MNASMIPVIHDGRLDWVLELAGPDCDVLEAGDVVLAIGNTIANTSPVSFLAMALPECTVDGMTLRMQGNGPHCVADLLLAW